MSGWVEARIVLDRDRIEAVSDLALALGSVGLQEDHLPGEAPPPRQPWDRGPAPPPTARALLRAWWEAAAAPAARAGLEARLAGLPGVEAPQWEAVVEADWGEAWKQHFHRIEISPALAVAPPWEARPGDLQIEPGLAFGTGEHPTTRAILEVIARCARPGQRCLDVGCGSGVLALAAAKLGMQAWGVDTDPAAVRSSEEAARVNGLPARFDQTPLAAVTGRFDLVVANLFAEVLVALAADLKRVSGGRLALAGILADRAHTVEAAFADLRLVARRAEGDWVALEYQA